MQRFCRCCCFFAYLCSQLDKAKQPRNGSVLKVTVFNREELPKSEWPEKSDPFFKVKLAPNGKEFDFPVQNKAEENWDCAMAYEGQASLDFEVFNGLEYIVMREPFDKDAIQADFTGRGKLRIKDVAEGWSGDLKLRTRTGRRDTVQISIEWPVRAKCFQ